MRKTLRSFITVAGALVLMTASVGCLLGPPEDPESPGVEYEEDYGYEDEEYGSESGALKVERPPAVDEQSYSGPIRKDEGHVGHGTPDPLTNPAYVPAKHDSPANWGR